MSEQDMTEVSMVPQSISPDVHIDDEVEPADYPDGPQDDVEDDA